MSTLPIFLNSPALMAASIACNLAMSTVWVWVWGDDEIDSSEITMHRAKCRSIVVLDGRRDRLLVRHHRPVGLLGFLHEKDQRQHAGGDPGHHDEGVIVGHHRSLLLHHA